MKTPHIFSLICVLVLSSYTANARLAAWYPMDEAVDSDATTAAEEISESNAIVVGLDPDPAFSLVTRGHPSARQNLGSSYLFSKGGGLDLGAALAVQPTDRFTITFWFQPVTLDAFDRFFESLVGNDNTQNGIRIDMGGSGDRFRILVRDGNGSSAASVNHPTTLRNDGTWYFGALRYDASSETDPFRVTLIEHTGDPVDEISISSSTNGPATINTGALTSPHAAPGTLIGRDNLGGGIGNSINAAFDEIAFYDDMDSQGVLTDAQLADVYNFGPSAVQLINTFTSDAESVAPGSPVRLSWTVSETLDSLILDDQAGNITDVASLTVAGSGSIEVSPTVATTYSLRATSMDSANVLKLRIVAGAAPEIETFTTSAPIIQPGGSVDLSWVVVGADSLSLDPGAIDVSALSSTTVSPAAATTYTLNASNAFGTSSASIDVFIITGPIPANRYDASFANNSNEIWIDQASDGDWMLSGASRETPLASPSENTNLVAAYSTGGGLSDGGVAANFRHEDVTFEIWLRPGDVPQGEHEVVFEFGSAENGLGLLLNETSFRFVGSALGVRTVDVSVPTAGLNLDDFIQVAFSISTGADTLDVEIRDTFGNLRIASEVGDIQFLRGNNGSGLFTFAAGAIGGGENNLGGLAPTGDPELIIVNGFSGEIALMNVYDRILDSVEIQSSFDTIATTIDPPVVRRFQIRNVDLDSINSMLELTWDSESGVSYDAEFSIDLGVWNRFENIITADSELTTEAFPVPSTAEAFFLRIVEIEM